MEALASVLRARTADDFNESLAAAEAELAAVFPPGTWGVSARVERYTDENIRNLWKNELSEPTRSLLEGRGGESSFREWLGEVHYAYVSLYVKDLFDRYQESRGWRVLAVSIPAVGVGAVGIASHYQQGQRHNRLGEVSNLLYDQAAAGLKAKELTLPGRRIAPGDWDGAGLMVSPVEEIAGSKLPDGQSMRLKYVRSTTVKKILASFITVTPVDLGALSLPGDLEGLLAELEKAGRALA